MTPHDLAILVVNWNVREMLQGCLISLFVDLAQSDIAGKVWIVDNASQDGSPDMIYAQFPQVTLVVNDRNLGFARGNNVALERMEKTEPPAFVLLLNPDTAVRPGAVPALFDFMHRHPRAGVAGARLYYGDGSFQHSAFGFPGLAQVLFDLFPVPARLHETSLNGRYPRAWYERGEPFPIDHPLGAAMMVRWDAIRQVGFFDENFHMYCEEIDWCMRFKRHGWDIFCVPGAEVVHYAGQSTQQIRVDSYVNLWRSRRRLYEKHYSSLWARIAKNLAMLGLRYQIRRAQREEVTGEIADVEADQRIQALRGALLALKSQGRGAGPRP